MIFQLSCLLLSLHRQPFGAVDWNDTISTTVDGGVAVHGVIRVDFAGGLFRPPAFLLYYAWRYSSNSSLVMSSYI